MSAFNAVIQILYLRKYLRKQSDTILSQVYAAPQRLLGDGGPAVQGQVLEKVPTAELQTHPQEQSVGEEARHHHTHQQGRARRIRPEMLYYLFLNPVASQEIASFCFFLI